MSKSLRGPCGVPLPLLWLWLWLMWPCVSVYGQSVAVSEPPLSERVDGLLEAVVPGLELAEASDAEFHRRLYLDLVGRGPTVQESERYFRRLLAEPGAVERTRVELIEDLLSRAEFDRYYSRVLEVMFTERREVISVLEFRAWIQRWLEERRPLNELCAEILAADGTGEQMRPAAAFMLNRAAEPHLVTRDIGRIFFGRDIQCAQCHDHPLVADYEQSEYFGILSFVSRTYVFQDEKRGNFPFLGEKGEGVLEYASVFEPGAGRALARPVLPMVMAMDAEPEFADPADLYVVVPEKDRRGVPRYSRRQQLAVLATHPENHSFNRNLANRLWAELMGVGVVHPVDMHHGGNPPISAALLRLLSEGLVEQGYDLRGFVREIVSTRAYRRSVREPELERWAGPPGGVSGLDAEVLRLAGVIAGTMPQLQANEAEREGALRQLQKAQAAVDRLQGQVQSARQQLQQFTEEREREQLQLAELQPERQRYQRQVELLQGALASADMALEQVPEDMELRGVRERLQASLTALQDARAALEARAEERTEAVEQANNRVEDQRVRVLALANRRLALSEFVVEARGVQRGVQQRRQALLDAISDSEQRQEQLRVLRSWLEQRERLRSVGVGAGGEEREQVVELERRERALRDLWRRSYVVRGVRGLNPEQMSGATYTALELGQGVRRKAESDWLERTRENPLERDNPEARAKFISAAVAGHQWDTVEDLVVSRFAAPAGAPQDSFFATVDQALTIQNDPTFQGWLKPGDGNLAERLGGMGDAGAVAEQLYLSVLGRLPDAEERAMVVGLLGASGGERAGVLQELLWGLLASTEFRFSM
ncbi:hypothetical protein LBMAG46_27700 [Planctomycetia bacterium]|nr:hypothetical protein LBMAG46_27700 [Planctomycetia bacterium]